ncbi:MAG: hypothetical protein A2Y71_11605 [Bacteroidetes bacterium RBG_13_42_15]|nr:MAG: hypothetical protein A2Y71_11605 [Bacteroidetes bacterium RBG_13_42_15]
MLLVRNIARIIVPVLLAVTLCFLTNTTINQHFHRLSSGIVVKHAHPFDKENTGKPFQEHQHSSSELVLLDQMYNTVFWIYLFILFLIPLLVENEIINFPLVSIFKNPDLYFLRNYRAPPVYSY